jgi:hypothetical protein
MAFFVSRRFKPPGALFACNPGAQILKIQEKKKEDWTKVTLKTSAKKVINYLANAVKTAEDK